LACSIETSRDCLSSINVAVNRKQKAALNAHASLLSQQESPIGPLSLPGVMTEA
jgi:hypothetical protein